MRKFSGSKLIAVLMCALAILAIGASLTPAEAHRSRVFIGVGTYFGPPYGYYPPPYYYYPPPVYYAPAPVYYAPAPAVVTPAQNCRDYRGDATVDGSGGQPFYGRACLQPDGKWHIVN